QPSGGGPVLAGQGNEDGVPGAADSAAGVKDSGDSLRMDSMVMIGVDDTQYGELSRRLAAGKVEVTLKGEDVTDQIANFSSRGPDLSFDLKPDLVAPGYDIRSTVPKSLYEPGEYRMSGTSMAAPHVAGAAALIRQLHPGQAPGAVRSELVGSSKALDNFGPTTIGSGRLDLPAAADAADAGITTSEATLSYGLADLSRRTVGGSKQLTVDNAGKRARTVRLKASGDATVTPSRVTVPAGGSAKVTVALRADRPKGEAEISGQVTVTPDGGKALRVPYLLVVRNLFVQAGPDPSDGHSGVAVFSPAPLAKSPTITVTSPKGKTWTVPATKVTDTVYKAEVTAKGTGAHLVSATADTADGKRLIGNVDGFEVTPEDSRKSRWEPIGPNSESGDVTVAPSRGDQAVLTQDNKAGPWVTGDNGKTWDQLDRLPVTDQFGQGDLVIDAENPDRWWYTVTSSSGFPRTGSILRTENRGRTWETLDTPDVVIDQLIADEHTKMLIAVTSAGLLISTDGGDHWTQQPTGVPDAVYDAELAGGQLYFASGNRIWARSVAADGTLGEARTIYETQGGRTVVTIAADAEVIAGYEISTGVVGSHDGGKTWSTLLKKGYGGSGLTAEGGDLYLGTSSGIHVGRDHGRDWSVLPAVNESSVQVDFDRWGDGGLSVSASSAGLYKGTSDGKDYRRIGVQGGTVNDLAVAGDALIAAGPIGTHRTALPASSPDWGDSGGEGTIGNTVSKLAVSPKDSKIVWRVRNNAWGGFAVERSGDAGRTWEEKGASAGRVTSLAVHPADPERVYVGYGNLLSMGLFSTKDGGSTWKNLRHETYFNAVSGDPRNPEKLLLGGPEGLFRSTDGGANVTKVVGGRVDTIERDGSRVLLGGDSIRVSTDGGATFRTADTGKLPVRVSDLLRVDGALYAASTSIWETALPRGGRGVLRSTDNGRTWHNVSTGLQNLDATTLATDGSSLYVGTVNGGVHRLKP
ncbi:S8 family serine peptidase, partial [Streptomyces sp. T-3]|nr:S8 family serine peptidase [Streptomyces sp. T-3]